MLNQFDFVDEIWVVLSSVCNLLMSADTVLLDEQRMCQTLVIKPYISKWKTYSDAYENECTVLET